MSKNSQDATFKEWEEILANVGEDEAELAGVAPYKEALRSACSRAMGHRCLREGLLASTQNETQRLNKAIAEGRDASIRLRNFLKGVLGPRNEKLRRYGIKPLRKHGRKARKAGCA
jgi:hypothetical protein